MKLALVRTGKDGEAFRPQEDVGKIRPWFEAVIREDDAQRGQRLGWALQLAQMMSRIACIRHRQARGRNAALLLARIAAGVTAAVTTITGGTLLAHLHGVAATVIGVTAVALGIIGAALAAVRPDKSYARDVMMAAGYENLWWDMYVFGTTHMPTTSSADFDEAMRGFALREAEISSTPAKSG
jgi:hypothetical protein